MSNECPASWSFYPAPFANKANLDALTKTDETDVMRSLLSLATAQPS